MSPCRTSSERCGRAAAAQRGGLLFWAIVILTGAAIGAFLVFHLVLRDLRANLLVTDEKLLAYVDQPLEVRASVLNPLDIELDEVVSTRVPVDTQLTVPLTEPLSLVVAFDTIVPLQTDVTVKDTIVLEQNINIDTVVQADLLGETFDLPLRGSFPVRAVVPVNLVVPVDQDLKLKFTAPIKARLHQKLIVPLKTEIVADVPLKTRMSVPVLNDLVATADVRKDPRLKVNLNYADLAIPVGKLSFSFADDEEAQP
ncbi:MAG: hypothetical protein WC809_04420 [Sinimarinibacterium sp.]|jgi:hypothetical protein